MTDSHTPEEASTQSESRMCELCWQMAYERMVMFGGSQAEHYAKLLPQTEGMLGHV